MVVTVYYIWRNNPPESIPTAFKALSAVSEALNAASVALIAASEAFNVASDASLIPSLLLYSEIYEIQFQSI